MTISSTIEHLHHLIRTSLDETAIIAHGNRFLADIRAVNMETLTPSDQEKVRYCHQVIQALLDFELEQEDFPHLRTQEDVEEVTQNLSCLLEKLNGCAIESKLSTQVRELLSRKATLPKASERNQLTKEKAAESTLQSHAPSCKRCDQPMLLRGAGGDYFWGCRDYPSCRGKRQLTKAELAMFD